MEQREVTSQLARALRERLEVISDHDARAADPAAHLKRLQEVSERIDSLRGMLSPASDPRLRHYLERASYDKALAFLESGTTL